MTDKENVKTTYPSQYQITGWIALLGLIMALAMVISSFILDEEATTLDSPKNPEDVIRAVEENMDAALLFVALDTFFIIGYTGLFIGIYMMTRDIHPLVSQIGLAFGLSTSIGDLIENSLLFALIKGVPEGWSPDPSFFVLLWLVAFFTDSCSYLAAVLFGVMLSFTFPRGNSKFTLGVLFLLYAVIGFIGYIVPIFMLIRALFFVIGLGMATLVLLREPEISLDDLALSLGNESRENFS